MPAAGKEQGHKTLPVGTRPPDPRRRLRLWKLMDLLDVEVCSLFFLL